MWPSGRGCWIATALQNLQSTRDSLAALIADVEANPKPDYSVDGQSVSWSAYRTSLHDRLDRTIATMQRLSGPFEVVTRAVP